MHKFVRIAIFTLFSYGIVNSFEQLPHEIITKIVVLEPQSATVLSATNKDARKASLEWAENHDASFLTDVENGYIRCNVLFILQHNKKITDDQIAKAVIEFVPSLIEKEERFELGRIKDEKENFLKNRFKSIAIARPFAVYMDDYNKRQLISYKEIEKLTSLGFLLPFIYVENQPIPLMHYLVKEEFIMLVASKRLGSGFFALLLQQGMNPFFMHEKKTVVDLLKETMVVGAASVACKDLIGECLRSARTPNDPQVVMYHNEKSLTIDAIEEQIRGE